MASVSSDFAVRNAVPGDVPKILQMLKEHVEYSKEPLSSFKLTEKGLLCDAFGGNPWCHLLVAEANEENNAEIEQKKVIGHAMYLQSYSSWKGKILFLEDLYVEPQYRGNGIGKMLLRAVAKIAVDSGCYKINWHVLDWNNSSHAFYKGIGAELCSQWHLYRLDNTAMLEFVGNGIGKMLLKAVAKIAVDSGCYKINWHVLDWNTSPHAFYKGIGAEVCSEWHIYKLENTAMLEFVGKETDIVG